MSKFTVDLAQYAASARQAVAEGCVLLKNDNEALPLRGGDKVAVFGRMAFHYYKSGLGSGGLVNARYVTSILDALRAEESITVDESVLSVYEEWIKEHPYDSGKGWGQVPWNQEEMPLSDELVQKAAGNDAAIVIVGRTAGEDQDNANKPGSYLLTDIERDMIEKVSRAFARTIVVLNVGNIIDMKWVEELKPAAVLYAWQGGQEGGNGVCDVLTGRVNPCGRLADTIAGDIADYPSTANFGDEKKNIYKEDIYVGYRYFETFAKDKVLYPFGYGLSYTSFSMSLEDMEIEESVDTSEWMEAAAQEGLSVNTDVSTGSGLLSVAVQVKNTGNVGGKEVVQVYIEAPQGALGKPSRVLAGYAKTDVLAPGEEETVHIAVPIKAFASFDDSGATGHKNCYVLEAGEYKVYVGSDVRSAAYVGSLDFDLTVVEELREAYAPAEAFERMRPAADNSISYEPVPLREFGPYDRMEKPKELAYTGDKGYKLADVYDGKVSMEDFIAQLSDEDLASLFRGEGMCSPKVTAGTGSAFGGLTESLRGFGIPATCTTDGPSGMRMDVGTKAFSLPNGTSLGCTFNDALVEELYEHTGRELRKNRVDALLGPGLNIHRNPLCGRNFEYISEDPLLTGKMGAAQIRGLNIVGSTGTIKHFCANNQEAKRRQVETVISQRALREIYLKGFEIAVKEGEARSVMTTYGPVNGIWTAGSYDLNTLILREEWGFDGIVMTDWWAESNYEGQPSSMQTHAPMVAAGNDLFKVCSDASDQSQDDVMSALQEGRITRGQLQRNAGHILRFILKSPAMLYEMDAISEEELAERKVADEEDGNYVDIVYYKSDESGNIVISGKEWETASGTEIVFGIEIVCMGLYDIEITAKSDLNPLAQLPVSVFYDNALKETFSFRGSEGEMITEKRDFGVIFGSTHYIKLYFGAAGLEIDNITFRFREEIKMPF